MFSGIDDYRENLDLRAIATSVATLATHPAYKSVIWPSPFPRDWDAFSERGFRAYLAFENELEWASHALLAQADMINAFLPLKAQFDTAILTGDFPAAKTVLDAIEERFGLSVWLAEARLSYLQMTAGFKAQREFTRQITAKMKPGLVRFIFAWIAFKYEENTSYAQLIRMIARLDKDYGVYYLLRLCMGDFTLLSAEKAGQTLSHTDTLPVIDRYIAFMKIVQAVQTSNIGDAVLHASIRHSLLPLANRINDIKVKRSFFASGGSINIEPLRPSFRLCLDAYTRGDYPVAQALCLQEIDTFPASIGPIDLLQRSRNAIGGLLLDEAADDSSSLKQEIGHCLNETIQFGAKAAEKRQRLQKIGVVYANSEWSAGVQLLVPPEADLGNPLLGRLRACYLALQSNDDHPLLAGKLAPLIPADRYLNAISLEDSTTTQLMRIAFASTYPVDNIESLQIPVSRRARYKAIALIERGANAEALPILRSIYEGAATSLDRLESGPLLVASLLRDNNLGTAADVAASLLLTSPYFASILPLSQLVSAIVVAQENGDENGARGNLSVAIVADMYARYIAPDQETARSDAYKDFLRANRVRLPSELAPRLADFPREEIIYFLRYVCVPEVMDQSLALPSTIAVEDERVAVLLMLTELAPHEHDRDTQLAFLEELREIRTRQVVRDTNKRLEQSKIFVNVDGIKKRVDASIKDNWDRYRLISFQNDESDLIAEVRKILEKNGRGKIIALPLSMPETERGKLFQQMVAEIRDLFVDSKEFGLDANLSANIRHGYVLREIRSPLLMQNLITNRPDLDKPYEENKFWASRLSNLTPIEQDRLQKALAAFSAEVDRKIDHLNGKVLRVNSVAAPEGMFQYSVNAPQLSFIQQRCEPLDKHEDFIQLLIEHFWAVTDYNLERVRKYLVETALQDFSDALDALDKNLDDVASSIKVTNLRSAITLSRPELQAAIGRVASWFTLSKEVDFPDYSAETGYQAGIETIKSYAANVSISSKLDCDESIVLRGRTLPFIGRIFFIILDNIVEHSGIASGKIGVRCSIRLDGEFLVFKIVSDLDAKVDLANVRRRANDVNAQYGTEKATQFISVERRSGYPKIWKILTHDLQVEHVLEVAVDDKAREFSVEIKMAGAKIVL
ncbi:MAG: hypothetical protein CTY36_00475 [Methylocystis sp.]|nr:MAG: hypothetical protein CTY36_00475 [Methylocystis sp.]